MARISLTDRAYREIKDRIIRYRLKPGARLRIDHLSARLGMSQTPVREALNRLEQEGLVERLPSKGFAVKALNLTDIEDIYDIRQALEVLAVRQAARRAEPTYLERLAEILEATWGLMDQGSDRQLLLKLSQEFHVVIMEASGNRMLSQTGQRILERIWMIQNVNLLTSGHMSDAHREHLQIFKALKAGRASRAGELMGLHLKLAKEFVIARLKDQDDLLFTIIHGSSLG